jgi:hypothetical protein
MADQKTGNEATPLGKLFGIVGFISGFVIGWNGSQNFWAAVICGLIVAGLGVAVGNFLHKLLVVTVSVALMLGTSYCRSQVFDTIRNGPRQSLATTAPAAPSKAVNAAPASAKVIVQRANLRPKPSGADTRDNTPLAQLELGETLVLLSPVHDGRGWYRVRHPGTGYEGWIHGNNIEFE